MISGDEVEAQYNVNADTVRVDWYSTYSTRALGSPLNFPTNPNEFLLGCLL